MLDRILVKPKVEHWNHANDREIVHCALRVAEGAVKVVALLKITNRLTESHCADHIPSVV